MNETSETLYTVREIAEKIKVSEATARYYKNNFNEFMPSVQTEGMQFPK